MKVEHCSWLFTFSYRIELSNIFYNKRKVEIMTNLITVETNNLPATLDDLAKFVLVGRDKLQAVRAEINAINKLNVAREVREQKLSEAQEIGALVLLAEAKCGELFNSLPKQSCNNPNGNNQFRTTSTRIEIDQPSKPKLEVAKELGFSKDQVSQFQKLADNPALVQKTIADAKDNGEIPTRISVLDEIKKIQKLKKANERLERKQFELSADLPADACKLFQADIRDGLTQISDNSIDFIITDPPYPKEYLPLYADLSKVAARILKDGGSLVCMTGQSYLPDVISELTKFMTYHWCMCYLTPGQTPQLWQKRTNTFWKPLIWLVKGEYKGDWIGNDVMESPANDKRFHEWGQSIGGMIDIVERFTDPNQIILDPFVGGGTTGVAAVMTGRKFIGVDISQECLSTTENRIKEIYKCHEHRIG